MQYKMKNNFYNYFIHIYIHHAIILFTQLIFYLLSGELPARTRTEPTNAGNRNLIPLASFQVSCQLTKSIVSIYRET